MKKNIVASLGLHWTEPVAKTSAAYDKGWSRKPNNDVLKQYTYFETISILDKDGNTWGDVTTYRKATEEQFRDREKISPESLPVSSIEAVVYMESPEKGPSRGFERFRAKNIALAKKRMEQYLARLFPELEQLEGEREFTASLRRLYAVFMPNQPNPYKYSKV